MNNSRPVYSTERGRFPSAELRRPSRASPVPGQPADGVVRIFRERGGRNGKVVTMIRGLPAGDVEDRAAELKKLCGAGGTVKDGAVLIQGDHRERVADALRARGYTVKQSGG